MATGGLAAIVGDEIAGVEAFIGLLKSEQACLQSAATDELERLAAEKTKLAGRLGELARKRNLELQAAGFAADGDGLRAWIAAAGAAARPGEHLLALAAEARELNRLNGRLIALRLNSTQAALNALTPESARNTLYGRDGQTSSRTGYRIIDSA